MADGDAEAPAADGSGQAEDKTVQEGSDQDASSSVAGSNNASGMGSFTGFPGMAGGLGGDMNQMQMMMAMQNGMMPGGFNFAMMGMLCSSGPRSSICGVPATMYQRTINTTSLLFY